MMGPVSSRDVIDLETSVHSAHAEIFVKLLVRASSDFGTRNGTQASHVVKQGN